MGVLMRMFLVFMSILTLSIALGSTMMTMVAIGGATQTIETSIDNSISQGQSTLNGYVTIDILPMQDSLIQQEIAQVKDPN